MNEALLYGFLLVFVRASAMLLAAPIFGSAQLPVTVRTYTTLSIAAALTMVLRPDKHVVPPDLGAMVLALAGEAAAGLLLGMFVNLVLQGTQVAGALIDLQTGLSTSQVLNPISGVSVTVISQFKYMLAIVLFLVMNGHHRLIEAFAASYTTVPRLGTETLPNLLKNLTGLLSGTFVLALQIALPVVGVSLVVDAALGLVNKAVPQLNVIQVGLPAKLAVGLIVLGVSLPALGSGVLSGVEHGLDALGRVFRP